MDLKQLKYIVSHGESENLEFKRSTANLKGAVESLCAFLNYSGGQVLIGVTDSKKILGQHVTDSTQQELAHVLRKLEPTANVIIDYVEVTADKRVIVLTAYPDKNSVPYVLEGRPYERKGTSTSRMSQAQYQQLLIQKTMRPILWEELPATGITINDLDHEEIFKTLQEGIRLNRISTSANTDDPHEILQRLQLIENGQLINAAAILYLKEIPGNYFQCVLRIARFRGILKQDFIDSQHVYGNAFNLLHEAEVFINRHTSISSHFREDSYQRIDKPEYPVKAVREALINALCHRDYSNPGGSITVAIYDDRIEISSVGGLPNGIIPEDLWDAHASIPRNRRVTNVFFRRGLIESFGTGTQEIIRLCKEAKLNPPDFYEQAGAFVVRLWAKPYEHGIGKAALTPTHVPEITSLTNRQHEIMESLSSRGPLTAKDLLGLLRYPPAERTFREDLTFLKGRGVINSRGRGRNAVWFIVEK